MMNNNIINQLGALLQNPSQYVQNMTGITGDLANDPDAIIQKMMAEGRVSQAQYNQARQMAQQIQKNPMFSNLFKNRI